MNSRIGTQHTRTHALCLEYELVICPSAGHSLLATAFQPPVPCNLSPVPCPYAIRSWGGLALPVLALSPTANSLQSFGKIQVSERAVVAIDVRFGIRRHADGADADDPGGICGHKLLPKYSLSRVQVHLIDLSGQVAGLIRYRECARQGPRKWVLLRFQTRNRTRLASRHRVHIPLLVGSDGCHLLAVRRQAEGNGVDPLRRNRRGFPPSRVWTYYLGPWPCSLAEKSTRFPSGNQRPQAWFNESLVRGRDCPALVGKSENCAGEPSG